MDETSTKLEDQLIAAARTFAYPPTPDIASRVARQRSLLPTRRAWAAMGLASAALVAMLLAPGLWSGVRQWMNVSPVPSATSSEIATSAETATLYSASAQATPGPSTTASLSLSPEPLPLPPSPGN